MNHLKRKESHTGFSFWRLCIRRNLVALFTATATLASVSTVAEASGVFGYRKQITINSAQVAGSSNLANFPVLINHIDPDLRTTVNGGRVENDPDGYDIIFRASDGITDLDFEVEQYEATTGTIVAWVRIPILDFNDNTVIFIYYGNPNITTSQENATGVWDPAYHGVWHLKEEQAGIGNVDLYQDSTSNNNHGDDDISDTGQTGQIDGGKDFDGIDDQITIPDPGGAWEFADGGLDAGTDDFCLSGWVFHQIGDSFPTILASGGGSDTNTGYWFDYDRPRDGLDIRVSDGITRDIFHSSDGIGLDDGQWHHVAVVFDREPASDTAYFYMDGNPVGSETLSGVAGHSVSNTRDVTIGAFNLGNRPWLGSLDEVRFSTNLLSASWIETEYNNQDCPTNCSPEPDFYWLGAEEACGDCAPLTVSESAGTITITAPDYFEMTFDTAAGGTIEKLFDLEEDPLKNHDLAGGKLTGSNPWGLYNWGLESAGGWYNAGNNDSGAELDLLEATPTRVRVRHESFLEDSGGGILGNVKAFAEYSITSPGKITMKWDRVFTGSVNWDSEYHEMMIHYTQGVAPLDTWEIYGESGGGPPPGPANDRFFVAHNENVAGARTDFICIIHEDWAEADQTAWYWSSTDERVNPQWMNTAPGGTYGTSDNASWDFLIYFKPTDIGDHTDPEAIGRTDDYRGPDPVSVIGPGSGWNENPADADFFNESEAAYTFDFDMALGLTFELDGLSTTRYTPFFKIRQWRSLRDPDVTLEGTSLTNDIDFRADVKPISRAPRGEILWGSTLQDAAAVTSPDVGSAGTVNGTTTFVSGKYGSGALFDANSENISFPSTGNIDIDRGAVELWYRPNYDHDDGVDHRLWHNLGDVTHRFGIQKTTTNDLRFIIRNGAVYTMATVGSADYSWVADEWVHIRVTWDTSEPVLGDQVRLFLNGVEPPHTDPTDPYDSSTMVIGTNYVGSEGSGSFSASGVIDEFRIYGDPAEPTSLAYGGLTSNSSEYLASDTNNFPLSFSVVDADGRGEYVYFGSDSKFRGLNINLSTTGDGAAPDLQWQYWNGITGTWADLEAVTGFTDETNSLTEPDGTIYWTAEPTGWSAYSVNGGPDLYYVRVYLASGDYAIQSPVEGLIKTDILLFQYCDDITADDQTFDFDVPLPTAVELVSFEAWGRDREVELLWQTGSEMHNLGFNLYRSTSEEGPYTKITSRLIPGLGTSPAGAKYSYRDTGLNNGVTYYYKLEDIETTGKTEMHGPVSAAPRAGAVPHEGGSPEGEPEESRTTVGDPASSELSIIEERPGEIVLELRTGGFYAEPQEDGTVRLSIPGFESTSVKGFPSLPVRRTWAEAMAGLQVNLVSVEAFDLAFFTSLHPSVEGEPGVEATPHGTVRATPSRRARVHKSTPSLYPEKMARVVSVGFQGDIKKALVEMAPLRWDESGRRLVLAHRLVVRLAFRGEDRADQTRGGNRGRRYRRRPSHDKRGVVARLVTKEAGLYGVEYEELLNARRGEVVRANSIRISRQGKSVPYHVQGNTLYFVSAGAEANPYGDEAVYELELGVAGERMATGSAAPSGESMTYYWERISKEENRLYQATLVNAPDLWLWSMIFAPAKESLGFDVSALATATKSAGLSVWLQGATDSAADPDHHVRLYVNGFFIAEESWDGKEPQRIDAELGEGILHDGENLLEIENVGDTEASYSMVMLNRFEVSYPRRLEAVEGRLRGLWDTTGTAEIQGTRVQTIILEEKDGGFVWLSGAEPTESGIRFHAEADRVYLAVSPEAVRKVSEIRNPLKSRLKDKRNRADYLMIGPREFVRSARELQELRRRQGLRVEAVAVEEIYSEFGFGEETPKAIKDFIAYTYHHWKRPPRYVLLLGDGTFDFKDYLGTSVVNRVPPLMTLTTFLETASDSTYAAVNGEDLLPDLAIGRLPAATVEELEKMVAKIVAWERSGNTLQGRTILVADNPDRGGDFVADAESLAATIPSPKKLERIYLSQLGTTATREKIRQAFDEGASIMSYIGHGGIHLWADENILNIGDMETLAPQAEQPLLLTMNCLNGYFHFPFFDALSETLVKAEGKGAIAAFAPSGLSLNDAAHVYHQKLLEALLQGDHERLGDAVLSAQAAYAKTGTFPELLSIFHLIGDPGMKLR